MSHLPQISLGRGRAPSAKRRGQSAAGAAGSQTTTAAVRDTLKTLSPELQGKWQRVKARFRAVSQHIATGELDVNIKWDSNAIGAATSSPKHRRRTSVEQKLTHKSNSRFSNVGVDKSEPIVVQARTLFDLFDVDHNGHLDRLEFKKLVRAVGGEVGLSRTEFSKKVKHDFDEIDSGHDHMVSFPEFHSYYRFLHKELISKSKKDQHAALKTHETEGARKDSQFFSNHIQTLDDAIRADNLAKVHEFVQNGEKFASGGVIPVVLAAHLGYVFRGCAVVCRSRHAASPCPLFASQAI